LTGMSIATINKARLEGNGTKTKKTAKKKKMKKKAETMISKRTLIGKLKKLENKKLESAEYTYWGEGYGQAIEDVIKIIKG